MKRCILSQIYFFWILLPKLVMESRKKEKEERKKSKRKERGGELKERERKTERDKKNK